MSGSLHDTVKADFLSRPVDRIVAYGRRAPTEVYELVAHRNAGLGPEATSFCEDFTAVVAAYRARDFVHARALAASFASRFPTDLIAPKYLERCDRLLIDPPPPNWDFTVSFTSK